MMRWLRWLHLYIGLLGGLVFVVLGLTGSVLAFGPEIERMLNPAEFAAHASGTTRPLDEMLAAAARARPDDPPPFRILMPQHAGGVVEVWTATPTDHSGYRITTVDPASAVVLGSRSWGDTLPSFFYRLHNSLFLGTRGKTVVGVVGLLMIVSVCTGGVLWWPRRAIRLRRALAIPNGRWSYGRHAELHKAVGAFSGLLLLVTIVSGVSIVFRQEARAFIIAMLPVTSARTEFESRVQKDTAPIGADRAVAAARDVFPAATLKRVTFPAGPHGTYLVSLSRPGEVRDRYGQSGSNVLIDQYSGEVLAVRDYRTLRAGDLVLAWLFPLHNGEALGEIGRWTVFVIGFGPLVLYVTGIVMWRTRSNARGRRAAPVSS